MRAAPGDRFTYWRGHLARDVWHLAQRLSEPDRRRLASVGRLAWTMAERGLVHLVQQRHGEGDFSYLAVARPRSRRPTDTLMISLMQEAA
ncbi:hypothetical protein GCM10011504_47530 [Siccirubricoccus deserti]|nr:hypothetical protein GCM10011504_47530 [Siccirubricoccus deserti]